MTKAPSAETKAWFEAIAERIEREPDDAPSYPLPTQMTRAAANFFQEQGRIVHVVVLLSESTAIADNAIELAMAFTSGEPVPIRTNVLVRDTPGIFGKRLKSISAILAQMVLSRIIDNFTTYVVEIISACLRAKAEIMRSDEKLNYETVFRADSLEQLREDLIDRKVNELAYLGFEKLADWIDAKFSLKELQNFPARELLLSCVQVRNCMVHNRGKANERYLQHPLPNAREVKVGEQIPLIPDLIMLAAVACAECVSIIDDQLASRCGVERQPVR